ncbi:hypothetical protein LZ24_02774 [Desulfobotulus alkaliphilus]|uniref:Uncharacterized protein n=1 Tax=Desulfobotulus alkaliphilus TaxID=622671 RepID=A0A562RFP6_9BACT|nr:hypothetical protein [Desulfobotulus alkaliphilus]TWI67240.1 hypothetical protein LZ24_02774 [Desulfobotulus alkaliphilus]
MSEKKQKKLPGIARLITGVAGFWIAVALVLPWMQTLPVIRPIMDIIIAADLDANQYFYTQSEETFAAQSHMRSGIRRSEQ